MKSWMIGALLLCAAVLGEAYAEDAEAMDIRLVSDVWPGYTNADGSGLAWEIMRLIFEPAGVRVDTRSEVYTRGVGLVQRGEADAWLGSYRDQDLGGVIYPRGSYAVDPVVALGLSSKPAPTPNDLAKYRLTWIRGYGYQRHLPGVVGYEEIRRRDGVLEMLERGRADFYIDALPEVQALLRACTQPDRYRITELAGLPMYPGFAATARGRSLAALYDRRLLALKDDGSLRALYGRWNQRYLFDGYPEKADAPR